MFDCRFRRPPGSRTTRPAPLIVAIAGVLVAFGICSPVRAERPWVFLNSAETAERGEIEYEQRVTWTTSKASDPGFSRFDIIHEIEVGLTDRLQLGLYVARWRYERSEGAEFRSVGVEALYNLWDPTTEGLGLTLYGEVTAGREFVEFEPKLIIEKQFGRWRAGYNLVVEAEWKSTNSIEDKTVLKQVAGISFAASRRWSVGAELFHVLVFDGWSRFRDPLLYLGPNFSVREIRLFGLEGFVTATPAIQLTGVDDEADLQVRLIFGLEF